MGGGRKGVGAMGKHVLGAVVSLCSGSHAEAAKHGIRAPVAKELDGVGVHTRTQEGGGTTRPEAADRWELGVNTSGGLNDGGAMAERILDPDGWNVALVPVSVKAVDGSVRRCVGAPLAEDDAVLVVEVHMHPGKDWMKIQMQSQFNVNQSGRRPCHL